VEIAKKVGRSKSWVSLRLGVIAEMSETVRDCIFAGKFPVYSYMYTLRQFMRINYAKKEEIDEFVNLVSGKNLSLRNIERLAHGYFKGSDAFREQIRNGNISWVFDQLKETSDHSTCNESERAMLKDLEIVQKYMQKVMYKANDRGFKNNVFYSQANLLAGGILDRISTFTKALRGFYDRTRQT
jgi:hypothetical protein